MESTLIEYLLTSMVIKRAIQISNAINVSAEEGTPRVEAKDQIEVAISELKAVHPLVMKALTQK
jgi:hypothetical protein